MKPFLSIIIPCHNDSVQLFQTLASINFCTPPNAPVEIIVVDDASETALAPLRVTQSSYFPTTLIRNAVRIGCAPSRRSAARNAFGDWLLFIDSHMVFHPGWFETFFRNFDTHAPNTVWCGTYLSASIKTPATAHKRGQLHATHDLKPKQPEIESALRFGGAQFFFTRWDGEAVAFMDYEGLPEVKDPPASYETGCIVGANYFVNRQWFDHINGLNGLRYWGADESLLSIKTYLAGGSCRVMRDIQIAHIKQPPVKGRTSDAWLLYNKLALANIIAWDWISDLYRLINTHSVTHSKASDLVGRDWPEIRNERDYLKLISKRSLQDYCERFGIETPSETIAMRRYTLPVRPINDNPQHA